MALRWLLLNSDSPIFESLLARFPKTKACVATTTRAEEAQKHLSQRCQQKTQMNHAWPYSEDAGQQRMLHRQVLFHLFHVWHSFPHPGTACGCHPWTGCSKAATHWCSQPGCHHCSGTGSTSCSGLVLMISAKSLCCRCLAPCWGWWCSSTKPCTCSTCSKCVSLAAHCLLLLVVFTIFFNWSSRQFHVLKQATSQNLAFACDRDRKSWRCHALIQNSSNQQKVFSTSSGSDCCTSCSSATSSWSCSVLIPGKEATKHNVKLQQKFKVSFWLDMSQVSFIFPSIPFPSSLPLPSTKYPFILGLFCNFQVTAARSHHCCYCGCKASCASTWCSVTWSGVVVVVVVEGLRV